MSKINLSSEWNVVFHCVQIKIGFIQDFYILNLRLFLISDLY